MKKTTSAPSSASAAAASSPTGQRTLDTMLQQEKTNAAQAEIKIMIQALHYDLKERIGKVEEKIEKKIEKLDDK